MPAKSKDKIIFILLGMLTGIFLVASTILGIKIIKKSHIPVRYDTTQLLSKFQKDNYGLFVASSLDRIFEDGKTLLKPTFSESASLSLAKNEYESFQVVLRAGPNELKSVWLEVSDLIDETTGAKLPKENISWRVVGYVPTKQPYYPVKYVGLWPDPLLSAKKLNIQSGITQPFWMTVYIPSEIPAGNYKGSIKVMADGLPPRQIPLSVYVYNFVLPKENHLKTAFDFYGHITKVRYPQGERETEVAYQGRIEGLNDKFIIEMLTYRMNPILNIDPMSQGELGAVDRYRWYGLNNFSIGKKGGTFNNNWPIPDVDVENLLDLYRTYGEILKLNRMLQYTYIYTWDEGDIGNPRVSKLCSMIHRAHPGLKNMVCYHGFWEPEENSEWGRDIDIWSFQIDTFDEKKMRRLQELGKEIWMYASGPSGNGSPNLAMDFDSIDYRIIPWLCWKYDIKGFLYWCVNWWTLVDPFKSAVNSQWEQNGNGLLFYPGENGPLASIRSEIFRDGMEDYEYIQLLIQKIKESKKRGLEAANKNIIDESIKILTIDKSIADSMTSFTKDGEVLKARRDAIAKKIEEFDRFLANSNTSSQIPQNETSP